jgi:hypothetical protein
MGYIHKAYVDVNGTDYSGQIFGIDVNRKLSDVGTCDVVLNNKGGQYKTTFSEMQRVAVAQGRAAFNAHSDFFTGTDLAACDAAKWTEVISDPAHVDVGIQYNKFYCYMDSASQYGYIVSKATVAQPFSITVWGKTDQTANRYGPALIGQSGNNYWMITQHNGAWYIYTRQGGAWGQRATGGSASADTWYRILIEVTSDTSITVIIQDVFGNAVWAPAAQTFDSVSNHTLMLGGSTEAAGGAMMIRMDSLLIWNASTPKGEQVFEGVIDKIEFTENPDMVMLHCVDDAWELEKQYDETYGRATATFTPSYGATDDVGALTSALLASGWTYTAPDCAIHDKQAISINTRRIYALNELLDLTPYLGWFILPMKHFASVMPDTDITPDSITEATAGWTKVGANNTLNTDNTYNIDGSFCLVLADSVGAAIAAYHSTNFSCLNYRSIILYYGKTVLVASPYIRIYTDTATPKYWQMNLPDPPAACGSRSNMVHLVLRLPDATGTHGWAATGAPSTSDNIIRFLIGGTTIDPSSYLYWDVLYFVAPKRLTSKYTISNLIAANRVKDADEYTRAIVAGSGITTQVADDATMQSTYGIREILINDQSITTPEPALAEARTLLQLQGWDDTADPIQVSIINPGDMYNVMLGDTVTVTVANMNLSSATRTIIARRDTLDQNGWITFLTLSGDATKDRVENLLTMAKRKRY